MLLLSIGQSLFTKQFKKKTIQVGTGPILQTNVEKLNKMSQSTITVIKSMNNSFHTKYLNLCKEKNFLPNHEIIKNKLKLEIVADRLKIYEWQMITKALEQDNSLQNIEIISRRAVQCGW